MNKKPQTMEDVSKELKKIIEFINSRPTNSDEYESELDRKIEEVKKLKEEKKVRR